MTQQRNAEKRPKRVTLQTILLAFAVFLCLIGITAGQQLNNTFYIVVFASFGVVYTIYVIASLISPRTLVDE